MRAAQQAVGWLLNFVNKAASGIASPTRPGTAGTGRLHRSPSTLSNIALQPVSGGSSAGASDAAEVGTLVTTPAYEEGQEGGAFALLYSCETTKQMLGRLARPLVTFGHVTLPLIAADIVYVGAITEVLEPVLEVCALAVIGFSHLRPVHSGCEMGKDGSASNDQEAQDEKELCCDSEQNNCDVMNVAGCPCTSCMTSLLQSVEGFVLYPCAGAGVHGVKVKHFQSVAANASGLFATPVQSASNKEPAEVSLMTLGTQERSGRGAAMVVAEHLTELTENDYKSTARHHEATPEYAKAMHRRLPKTFMKNWERVLRFVNLAVTVPVSEGCGAALESSATDLGTDDESIPLPVQEHAQRLSVAIPGARECFFHQQGDEDESLKAIARPFLSYDKVSCMKLSCLPR